MKLLKLPRIAIGLFTLFFAVSAFSGPSYYTENPKKQIGKMVVGQFSYPGYPTLSASLAPPAPGPDYQLKVGSVLNVIQVKQVKSKYPLPGKYTVASKTLFIPLLIVKNKLGWSYFDVT